MSVKIKVRFVISTCSFHVNLWEEIVMLFLFFTLREVCNVHIPINRLLFPWLKQYEADHLVVRTCMELIRPLSHTSLFRGA